MIKEYYKETEMLEHDGQEWQVCYVSDATEPGSCGETEILYGLMNRHGDLKEVLDWELAAKQN